MYINKFDRSRVGVIKYGKKVSLKVFLFLVFPVSKFLVLVSVSVWASEFIPVSISKFDFEIEVNYKH